MFQVHQPIIGNHAATSPVGTFDALAFAILSANAGLGATVRATRLIRRKALAGQLEGFTYGDFTVSELSQCGPAMSRAKLAFVQAAWQARDKLWRARNAMGAVEFWDYLLDTVAGIGTVKAAFAVQLIYGKLGCLDTHNIRLLGINPNITRGKTASKRQQYLDAQSARTSERFWDDWCHLVAERYPLEFNSAEHVSAEHVRAIVWEVGA